MTESETPDTSQTETEKPADPLGKVKGFVEEHPVAMVAGGIVLGALVAGAVAGTVSTMLTHPFDVIKTRQQSAMPAAAVVVGVWVPALRPVVTESSARGAAFRRACCLAPLDPGRFAFSASPRRQTAVRKRAALAARTPASALSLGSGTPITPVEETKTSSIWQSRWFATCSMILDGETW